MRTKSVTICLKKARHCEDEVRNNLFPVGSSFIEIATPAARNDGIKRIRHSETAFGGRGYLFRVRSSWDEIITPSKVGLIMTALN